MLSCGSRRVLHVVVIDLAEHPLLHGVGQDRVDRAEVLFHPCYFGRDPGEELQIGLVRVGARLPALPDEVPDLRSLRLAVPVDAADPLLQLVRVERDVVVDQPVAVLVQVDALAGRVGGEQDADLVLVGWCLERKPELFPLPGIHPAVEQLDPLAGQSFLGQEFLQPDLRVAVLGEHNDALIRPVLTVGAADAYQVGNELLGLGVGHGLVPRRPLLHSLEESDLLLGGIGQLDLDAARPGCRVVLGLGELLVVVGRDVVQEALHPFGDLVVVCAVGFFVVLDWTVSM